MSEQNTEFDINQPFVTQEQKFKYWEESKAHIKEANKRIEALESEVAAFEAISFVQMKQIDELQASNHTLRGALESCKSALVEVYNDESVPKDLRQIADESHGIAKRALYSTPAESLQARDKNYRDAILEVKRQIESNRVWSGMKYTYTPMPEFKQIMCIEAIDAALKEVKW